MVSRAVVAACLGIPLSEGGHLRGDKQYPQDLQQAYPQQIQQGYPQGYYQQGYPQGFQGYQQPVYAQVSPYAQQLNQMPYAMQAGGPQYFFPPEQQQGQQPAVPEGFDQVPPAPAGNFSAFLDRAKQQALKGFQKGKEEIMPAVNLFKAQLGKMNLNLTKSSNSRAKAKYLEVSNFTGNLTRETLLRKAKRAKRMDRFLEDFRNTMVAVGGIDAGLTEKTEMEKLMYKMVIGSGILFGPQHRRKWTRPEDDMLPDEILAK